jgi:predicted nucleic acid-binding protein
MAGKGVKIQVLVDTSVWIDHFKNVTDILETIYNDDDLEIALHSMVIAELVLGGIKKTDPDYVRFNQQIILDRVNDDYLIDFIIKNGISGKGIGYVDANLVASCVKSDAKLITSDKRLRAVSEECGVLYRGE